MCTPGQNGEDVVTFENTALLAGIKVDLGASDIESIPDAPLGRIRALFNGDILCYNPAFTHFVPENNPGVTPPAALLHYYALAIDVGTGRVEALCPGLAEFNAWYATAGIGPGDILVDLGERVVTPGLIDAHAHLAAWGMILGDYAFDATGRECTDGEFFSYPSIPSVVRNANCWLAGEPATATDDECGGGDWVHVASVRPTHPWVFLHGFQNSDTKARCLDSRQLDDLQAIGLDGITEADYPLPTDALGQIELLDSSTGPYAEVPDEFKLSVILSGLGPTHPPALMLHGSGQMGWLNSTALALAYADPDIGPGLRYPDGPQAIPYAVQWTPENRFVGPTAQVHGRAVYEVREALDRTKWWVFTGTVRHYEVLGKFERLMTENPLLPDAEGHEGALRGLYRAVQKYHAYGITAAHDCILPREKPEWKCFEAYEAGAHDHTMAYVHEDQTMGYDARRTLRMHVRLHYYCENEGLIEDFYSRFLDPSLGDHDGIRLGMNPPADPHSWVKFLGWKFALDGGMLAGSGFSQSPYSAPSAGLPTPLTVDGFRETPAVETEVGQGKRDRTRSFGLLLRGGEGDTNAFVRPASRAEAEAVMDWMRSEPELAQRGFVNLDADALGDVDPVVSGFIERVRLMQERASGALESMIEVCRSYPPLDPGEDRPHQVALHAVSDGAVAVYCNALRDYWAAHPEDGPDTDPRFRIEHALWTPMDVIWKFLRGCNAADFCGALISTQPGVLLHGAPSWHRMFQFDILPVPSGMPADSYGQTGGPVTPIDEDGNALLWDLAHEASAHLSGPYGHNRTYYILPLREFLSAKIPVAFGSDPPANAKPDPRDNFVESILRAGKAEFPAGSGHKHYDLDLAVRPGTGVVADDCQWIGIGEALACHTYWAAFAAHDENDMGWFSDQGGGTFADLVVWAGNPLDVEADLDLRRADPLQMEDPEYRNRVGATLLEALTPLLTVVEGEVVHLAE